MNMKDMKSIGARLASGPKAKSGDGLIDAAAIRELAELLTETGLTEIEIEHNGARLRVARQSAGGMPATAVPMQEPTPPATVETPKAKAPVGGVPSPMVGTVYASPEPNAPPFIKVGQSVKEGHALHRRSDEDDESDSRDARRYGDGDLRYRRTAGRVRADSRLHILTYAAATPTPIVVMAGLDPATHRASVRERETRMPRWPARGPAMTVTWHSSSEKVRQ